jgi:hypothetical protein
MTWQDAMRMPQLPGAKKKVGGKIASPFQVDFMLKTVATQQLDIAYDERGVRRDGRWYCFMVFPATFTRLTKWLNAWFLEASRGIALSTRLRRDPVLRYWLLGRLS